MYPLIPFGKYTLCFNNQYLFSIIQIPAIVLLPFLGVWLEKKNLKHGLMLSNALSVLLFTVLNVFLMTEGFHFYFLLGISFLEKSIIPLSMLCPLVFLLA